MSDMEKDAVLQDEAAVDDEVVSKTLTSGWKRFLAGSSDASAENETKRAMQSRHLMMIGECLSKLCRGPWYRWSKSMMPCADNLFWNVRSNRRDHWDGYFLERWICKYSHVGASFIATLNLLPRLSLWLDQAVLCSRILLLGCLYTAS
jgi:hypothetical protein